MGTWIKETDRAIYLMEGGGYIALVAKQPSPSNSKEQVANITPLKAWFARPDKPRSMTVSVGTGAPEPNPIGQPPSDTKIEPNGQLKVISDTYFKLSPKPSNELPADQKVFVKSGSIFTISGYSDVGNYHWLIELTEPSIGNGITTAWYVFTPDIRLGTDAVLTVTYDTYFKLEPKPSSELPNSAKVFVSQNTQFKLAAFMPAAADHTQVELADRGLGQNNTRVWYVYNPHFKAETDGGTGSDHQGMQIRVVNDSYFTLQPQPANQLPAQQKVWVTKGSVFNIQYYTDVSETYWRIELVKPELGNVANTSWYINTRDAKLISNIILRTTSDTTFKLEPKPSSELPDFAKVSVRRDSQFQLIFHLPASGNHSLIELADTTLGSNEKTTWYAYNPHISIQGQRQLLATTSDTFFKTSTASSSSLPADQKVFVPRNTIFAVSSYAQPAQNHVRVSFKGVYLGTQNRNTWYCYLPDVYLVGTEIGNNPNDNNGGGTVTPGDRGIPLQFPGFTGTYYSNDPIFWKTQYNEKGYFTWGDALHVDAATGNYRQPTGSDVIYGIQRIATAMEDIRKRYGNVPIQVNSWYRDPKTNSEVGGASQSRHLLGDAVDFVVPGVHPYNVYADLDAWWGSRGGLASSSLFTHIDARGYKARWDYDSYDLFQRGSQQRSTGTWVKETDIAIYLMKGNVWISRITKAPSTSNPKEQVVNITGMAAWFTRPDAPTAMTISMGTGAPEPDQWVAPTSPGEINASGLEIIKHFEGLRTTAYQDSVGVWTIGYGHTSMAGPPTVYPGMTITAAEAEIILQRDLDIFEQGVTDAVTIATNSDQFSAMVSFSFNVGLGAYQDSTLLRKHNAGDFPGAANEFLKWIYAGGQVLPGLERRRQAERALYLSQDYSQFLRTAKTADPLAASSRYVAIFIAGLVALTGLLFGLYTLLSKAPKNHAQKQSETLEQLAETWNSQKLQSRQTGTSRVKLSRVK